MPIRITVSLNTNQSQKAPLLLPTSALDAPPTIPTLIFNAAKSKLRLKKPTRIFVAGTGQELFSTSDWTSILRDDIVLLVSAGEDYVGLVKSKDENGDEKADTNPDCPIYMLAQEAPVEELAVSQLNTTARTLKGMVSATGQPDLCPGTKFPVGAVFVSKGWIHPPLIGGDIGCGMAWYKTRLTRGQVDGDKGRRVAEKLRGVEGIWRTRAEREEWLRDEKGSCSAGEEWDVAVGTIGAGNHFAEIQVVEEIGEEELGLRVGDVVLLVHSGSRGYGGSILRKFTSEGRVSLQEGSEKMKEYMEEHGRALRWAKANRDLIALRFLACLEPGEEVWQSGRNAPNGSAMEEFDVISLAKAKVQERKVVDIWHNNLERVKWPPTPSSPSIVESSISDLEAKTATMAIGQQQQGGGEEDYVYIHRKGAAPTHDPEMNIPLPLLPLPGSRGTPTLMIKPTFSARTSWGRINALSLAHGSGRSMSRAKALSSLSAKYKNRSAALLEPGSGGGTWVVCDEKDLVFEEAPDAYKDVYAVSEDLVREGVAEVVGLCIARVSYKVRNEAR